MPSSPHDILKEYWGYDNFRPLQEDIINHVLQDKDALALLPTGGGKSLCFQVPAMLEEGICIVVSPLIALMKDQVENLKKRGILAAAIHTGMSRRAIVQTLKNVAHGPYKFLYVSPERLETGLFREYLPAMDVNLIAVDEAHCISQWGFDFRPSYRRIATLREELPDVPLLALTASATVEVQQDIITQLQLRDAPTFRQSFLRPNLSYSVLPVDSRHAKIADIVSKVPGTAIVYARSRKRTVEIADLLRMHGHSAEHYHAGLSSEERTRRQQDWIDNKTRVMVCTNAFGMGIDKPDVRLVVHADVPDSLEGYYQEAGRAGRDGNKSYAVLLHTAQDLRDLDALHEQRYPSFDEIKAVYAALVNYLQIPSYTGEDRSYSFHYDAFVRNFGLDPFRALYALKALEGDGWFDYNEKSYAPATVCFDTNKRGLNEFQEAHPELEPLLTTLLRTYAGVFDVPVFISELQVAQLMGLDLAEVVAALKRAAAFGVIDYTAQNEDPKLVFRRHRVQVEDFRMNTAPYEKRRAAFRERVGQMIAYTATTDCRSRFINRYFGESDGPACGICDRCLARKKAPLDSAAFEQIRGRVEGALRERPLTVEVLLAELRDVAAPQLWQVLDFLQAEQKICVGTSGELSYR
ncbi:RecQ family ATP-dependent DNA helicase [Flaviaesturariibacter terrae]